MRHLLIVIISLLTVTILRAATITRDEARQQAQAFLSGRTAGSRSAQPSAAALADAPTPSPAYYAFNIGSGEGFVIVAADDRPEAVIGYSDSGAFSAAKLPENARAWLDGANGAYGAHGATEANGQSAAQSPHQPQSPHPAHSPQPSQSPVRPLLTTQWGQQWPYSSLCPVGGVTGCVATAMAQVMNYHQWPQTATTAIPAYSNYKELPPVTFDWADMPAMATDDHYEAIAQLLHYCGKSVKMKYGGNSWAYEQDVPIALTHFFGYDGAARVVYSSDYATAEWETLILDELQAGRPVVYGGERVSTGHEFVIDGYDGEGFFHFNWGWAGESDGWYRLTAANPASVGTGGGGGIGLNGYSSYQSAVIGIQPDRGGTAPAKPHLLTAEEMVLTSETVMERSAISKSFTVSVCCPFTNHSDDTIESGFGLALIDADSQFVPDCESVKYARTFVPSSYIYRGVNQDITFGANMTGTYRIVPVCTVVEGKEEVMKLADGADRHYIEAVLTETTLTLTEHPCRNLQIDDIQFTLMGSTMVATAAVSNHGDDYNGLLYLFISGVRETYTGVNVEAGTTTTVTFCYQRRWMEQEYQISYTKDNSRCIAQGKANYTTIQSGQTFSVWHPDGTEQHITIGSNSVATIPSEAVAVDFGSTVPETIIPNANPNCLFYADYSSPALEQLRNVVINHYAQQLTLTDGEYFYCPMDFTAGNAVYTRKITRGYDGNGSGWDTIILPFNVTTVTTGEGQSIDWFRSPDNTDKDFWLMTIATTTETTLTFSHANRMEANRPYLLAVPGPAYGERSLQGRTLTFSAKDVIVHQTAITADSTEAYTFTAAHAPHEPHEPHKPHEAYSPQLATSSADLTPTSYQLNAAGNNFTGTLRRTPPFRASLIPRVEKK